MWTTMERTSSLGKFSTSSLCQIVINKISRLFRWLSIVLVMVFTFLLLVILLRLLVAQMSSTYSNITNDRVRVIQLNRASVICRFERSVTFRILRFLWWREVSG